MHSASEHGNNRQCCMPLRWPMNEQAKSKEDFEAARLDVFAIPGLLLTHFELRNPGSTQKE
jgi:hypothetical protein